MKREKIQKLFILVEKEVEKAKENYLRIQNSAAEIARVAANSPSQSGDRFHSQGQTEIAKENLVNLENILQDLKNELNLEKPDNVRPSCYIELEFDDDKKAGYYFLNHPLHLDNLYFTSVNSPLGMELNNKKAGERFELISAGLKKSGKIISIQ